MNVGAHPHALFAPGTPIEIVEALSHVTHGAGGHAAPFIATDDMRWQATATNGANLNQGDPTTLTWSIVPDDTFITGTVFGDEDGGSELVAFMDTFFGFAPGPLSARPWFGLFEQALASWGDISGLTFVYEPNDDGTDLITSDGQVGVRGDLRIGGHPIDGTDGVLAYNYLPVTGGDMVIDTSDLSLIVRDNNSRILRNTLAHEFGHALGLDHVMPVNESKLMEPFLSETFEGPQHDDILAINRLYGDRLERNDTAAQGYSLGTVNNRTVRLNNVSVDGASDVDYFRFTVAAGQQATLSINPEGISYESGPQGGIPLPINSRARSDLSVQVFDAAGTTLLAAADEVALGGTEIISALKLPAAGDYVIKVQATQIVDQGIVQDLAQLYGLKLTTTASASAGTTSGASALLGGTASISGVKWADLDGDGVRDANEPGLANVIIYADLNNSGRIGSGEPAAVTGSDGRYTIRNLPAGTYTIREVVTPELRASFPVSGFHTITVTTGQAATGINFGNQPIPAASGLVAVNDVFTVTEDSINNTLDVLANDVFDGIGTRTITAVGATSSGGTASIFGGTSIRYTPAANFFGTETFTYSIADGTSRTSQATVTVNVTGVNDPPTAVNDAFTVAEDSTNNTLNVLANDSILPDGGETLTITGVGTLNQGGTVAIVGGTTLQYTPAANFFGTETFTYTINDGTPGSNATATVTMTVTPVNDPPTANPDSFQIQVDSSGNSLNVLVNDSIAPDTGESLTIISVGTPNNGGTVTIATGSQGLIYSPAAGFVGTETFTYTINDGTPGSNATATVTIEVLELPALVAIRLETSDLAGNPIASVAQGDNFRVSVFVEDLRGTVDGGVFSAYLDLVYNSALVSIVPGSLTHSSTYPNGRKGNTSVPPTIDEGGAVDGFAPLGPGEFLLFTVQFQAVAAGQANFTSNPADDPANEVLVFGLGAEVSHGRITYGSTSIGINPPGFSAGDDLFTVNEDSTTGLDVLANDTLGPGGTSLSITAVGPRSNGGAVTIVGAGTSLSYTPAANFFGTETFTYTISNGIGGIDQGLVTMTVDSVNDEPTFDITASHSVVQNSGPQSVSNFAFNIGPGAANESGQVLTFQITSNTNPGLFTTPPALSAGGTLTYAPASGVTGVATISVRLVDNGGTLRGGDDTSVTKTFTISITPLSGQLTANDDSFTVNEDSGATSFNVLANDALSPSGGTLTISAVGPRSNGGTATITNGSTRISYSPAANFFGTETFTYTLVDGIGGSDQATVTVTVNPVNDEPSFDITASHTSEQDSGAQSVIGFAFNLNRGAANESAQTLTFQITSNSNPGLFLVTPAITSSGTLSYTPAAGATGSATIGVQLQDNGGTANGGDNTSAIKTFTITVNPASTDDIVAFRVETTNLSGTPITSVTQGSDFLVRVFTQDLRGLANGGVFSAYLDMVYDSALVLVVPGSIVHGPSYGGAAKGSTLVPPTVDEVGSIDGLSPLGPGELLLFTVRFTAFATGQALFTTDPADNAANEVLVFGSGVDVPDARIDYGSVSIDIVSALPLFSNLTAPHDVDNNGLVSPLDALHIINELEQRGARSLVVQSETAAAQALSAATKRLYVDVNGDNFVTPLDALLVINELSRLAASTAQAAPRSVLASFAAPQGIALAMPSAVSLADPKPESNAADAPAPVAGASAIRPARLSFRLDAEAVPSSDQVVIKGDDETALAAAVAAYTDPADDLLLDLWTGNSFASTDAAPEEAPAARGELEPILLELAEDITSAWLK